MIIYCTYNIRTMYVQTIYLSLGCVWAKRAASNLPKCHSSPQQSWLEYQLMRILFLEGYSSDIDEYKYYEPLVDKVLALVRKLHERIRITKTEKWKLKLKLQLTTFFLLVINIYTIKHFTIKKVIFFYKHRQSWKQKPNICSIILNICL